MIVVCGAGGFIGGHFVAELLRDGQMPVRAVDLKPLAKWEQLHVGIENVQLDLRDRDACFAAAEGGRVIYNFAADMGGMGYIAMNRIACMRNVLINTHVLEAAVEAGVEEYFFASSACVYNTCLQRSPDVVPLKESDAYPALPEDGYGWEKLFSERACQAYGEDTSIKVRIARFHNIYGPFGAYYGGREKAPAAICRKVALAKLSGHHQIEIWGDGKQTRSFTYISDCVDGIRKMMTSSCREPLNLGSAEMVSIDQLVDIVEGFDGLRLQRHYDLSAPIGVAGRSSDNSRVLAELNWEPSTPLVVGLENVYRWVYNQLAQGR
ncbi:MAG: NAD-dependent epimerase/dehydratase family protein [Hyphomicrobiaceae bacterium]